MKKFWSTLAFASLLGGCAHAPNAPDAVSVDAHVARAREVAGSDLGYLTRLCQPQPAEREAPSEKMEEYLRNLIAKPAPPAMQVFDNLYFVGADWVSAWLLKTSQGLILIDSLNNGDEAHRVIEGGMAKLGLDPHDIKYIVVTHAHGDHYGGASYLVGKYHPRVIASEADWNTMEGTLEFTSKLWDAPPKRDIAVHEGQTLTLGDTTMTFFVTTGHTLGTLSPLFDVRSHGQVHHVLLWGGTSFNFGKDFSRLASYSANTERMGALARKLPVDVLLSNHSGWDGSIDKMKALRAGGAGAPNPFVTGPQAVVRSFEVMDQCAQAQAERFGY